MSKKGSFISLFIMMIVVLVVVIFSVVMIYASDLTLSKLHETMDGLTIFGNKNASEVINETFGKVPIALGNLPWITVMLIFSMALSIFYGSYKVRTKPIYFVPYFIITGIAIIIAAGVSNAYEDIIANAILSATFAQFTGANHFLLFLPVYISIIGMVGGIIMFISWATRPLDEGYSYYGS